MRGLRTKLHHLRDVIHLSDNCDVIILTETWLNNNFNDAELSLVNFNIYRRDRDSTSSVCERGGGVLIAVKKNLRSFRNILVHQDIEQLFVTISGDAGKVVIGAVYLHPRAPSELYYKHCEEVEMLLENNKHKVLIVGDYNLPGMGWRNVNRGVTLLPKPDYIQSIYDNAVIISDSFGLLNLNQFNNITNPAGECLDLIFSNAQVGTVFGSLDPLIPPDSYHPPLVCDVGADAELFHRLDFDYLAYDFGKANYREIFADLESVSWSSLLNLDLSESLDKFYQILRNTIVRNVPMKTIRSSKYPIWYNKVLRDTIKEKNKYHRKMKKFNTYENYIKFSRLRSKTKQLQKQCFRNFVGNIEDSMTTDAGSFWRLVNAGRKEHGLPSLLI